MEKIESVHDMSRCRDSQRVKYTTGSFVGKALTWWNSEIRTRGREAAVGMSWEDFRTLTREEFCPSNEMQKLETELWNHAMVGAGMLRILIGFMSWLVSWHMRREEMGENLVRIAMKGRITRGLELEMLLQQPQTLLGEVTPVELGSKAKGNHQNQVVAVNGGQGRRNQGNQARGRAFMLGAEEARQDPNVVTGTFTLNDHYATTLFDSGADYSFVSTTFIPLLDIEPNDLGFSYEIEIASGQLVEIDKIIRGAN
ncbi:reverse transcriptase domain-containing protein [Tanacetum coccineum]